MKNEQKKMTSDPATELYPVGLRMPKDNALIESDIF